MGYGTQTPQSITGKAIGGFCAIVGVFILTLPVPIVVNSFASYYKNRLWRNEVAHKRSVRAAEQAELVKELFVNSRRPSLKSQNSNRDDDGKFHLKLCVFLTFLSLIFATFLRYGLLSQIFLLYESLFFYKKILANR